MSPYYLPEIGLSHFSTYFSLFCEASTDRLFKKMKLLKISWVSMCLQWSRTLLVFDSEAWIKCRVIMLSIFLLTSLPHPYAGTSKLVEGGTKQIQSLTTSSTNHLVILGQSHQNSGLPFWKQKQRHLNEMLNVSYSQNFCNSWTFLLTTMENNNYDIFDFFPLKLLSDTNNHSMYVAL